MNKLYVKLWNKWELEGINFADRLNILYLSQDDEAIKFAKEIEELINNKRK